MADEELVAELAREVAAALRAACPTEEQCLADEDECFQRHPIHHGAIRDGVIVEIWAEPDATAKLATETVLAWLAERGWLIPDGAQVAEEWGTRHHFQSGATTDTRFGSRDDASDVLLGRVAAGLPTSLIRRQVITGPWVAVPEEPTDG